MKVLTHKEKIDLNKKGILWHGISVENAKKVFNQGSFKAFTSQRFWNNGIFLREDHPDYEKSYFKYGWCMSRDINVSKTFGEVLFAFEKNRLQTHFKVKPYAWNFCLVKDNAHAKQEREEFIMNGGFLESLHDHEEKQYFLEKKMDKLNNLLYSGQLSIEEEERVQNKVNDLYDEWEQCNFHEKRKQAHGKEMPLEMATGFLLRFKDYNSMGAYRDFLDKIVKHDKFLGFID